MGHHWIQLARYEQGVNVNERESGVKYTGIETLKIASPSHQDVVDLVDVRAVAAEPVLVRGVALQVAFERQTLKPVFHLIVVRIWA
jgi:hypothetical protein